MRGPQNGDSAGDTFRGSSLNLGWSKCGVWWVGQWIPVSWLHIESSRYYWMHAWVFVFTWDIDVLIMMIVYFDWGFRLWQLFPCFIAIFVWDIDMLIMLIAHLTLLSLVTLFLPCLFWLPHMYRLTTIYHSAWHVDFLTCILFWLSLSMMIVSLSIWLSYSRLPCVYIDDTSELCLIVCCMTALLLHDCALLVYVGRTSIPLSPIL